MADYRHMILAAYSDPVAAEQAVNKLLASGLPATDVSLVGRDRETREAAEAVKTPEFRLPKGEEHSGAVAGAWIGGIGGLLLGSALLLVPGIGTLVAFGPLAVLLSGAINAINGGLWGWGFGATDFIDESAHHRELLIQGKILVVVHSTTEAEAQQARSLLQQTNPDDLDTVSYAIETEKESAA